MRENSNKYLLIALLTGILFHTSALFFTLENTYDALIHMFFGGHYAESWFEPWNYSWYTGFTVMGYPPLVHQMIGLLSFVGGLKFGLFAVAILSIILYITGIFRFTITLTGSRTVAGYTAIIAVFSSSFVETLHIFGQLPSIVGISLLMHTLPDLYLWLKTGRKKHLGIALALLSVTVTSHHVTPIFGMVFFISPLVGLVIMDQCKDITGSYKKIKIGLFIKTLLRHWKRIAGFIIPGLVLIVVCILPYWINSKNNPITQVPIPHGSRDNFLEVVSSGIMFCVIPWGIMLFVLPYIFYRFFSKRYIFFGICLSMLFLLGTGGTTPLPKMLLGDNAFNILTLDRFTLWGSIMSLPIFGEFVYRLIEGDFKGQIIQKTNSITYKLSVALFAASFLFMGVATMTFGYFRPFQPEKINLLPIINFLNQDQHDQWRYLPLGFGDQMAVLSTKSKAMTVDGNYHSARRLPELTSRAVERLENSKFRGTEGIGSLQQFLTVPEKYNLKYVFSNDKFYDPILYFCGWHRLSRLENGIMVWEKLNVNPLPDILPKGEVPTYLKMMWGIIPLLTVFVALLVNFPSILLQVFKLKNSKPAFLNYDIPYKSVSSSLALGLIGWILFIFSCIGYSIYLFYIFNASQISPRNVVFAYYNAIDFKKFEKAHSYLNPESEKSLAQFMLEVSVADGVLNSYAKLESIAIETVHQSERFALVKARTKWVTPLEVVHKEYEHEIYKHKDKWYIEPNKVDTDLPPDQFITNNSNVFFKHGRRKITTQQTHHEDILKQPDLEIISARLIKIDSQYCVVGELQNIDNFPADVVLKTTLYDDHNKFLATFNAKNVIKHKLLPKETTSFRVNFEDIAWLDQNSSKPTTFDPNEFSVLKLDKLPVTFDIQCAGNVTVTDLYNEVGISHMEFNQDKIEGTLFNHGTQEVTIPELIISYYNSDKELIYVDHHYLSEGVRIQRKQNFSYSLLDLSSLESIKFSTENCFINGLPNKGVADKIVPNRIMNYHHSYLQPIKGKGFDYIKIEVNNYIGNPN